MRELVLAVVAACCLLTCVDIGMAAAASGGRQCPSPGADPGAASAVVLQRAILAADSLRIVCLGSSSTQGVGASGPAATYPARLGALLAKRLPGRPVEVVNKGIGGETVADNVARLGRDVALLKPGLVVWQVGTNDALRGLDPAVVRAGLLDGIARIRAAGAEVVLMDPQPLNHARGEAVAAMARLVREVAAEAKAPLLSRHAAMRRWLAEGAVTPASLYAPDGLHMADAGYDCLAQAVADLLVPPPRDMAAAVAAARR